MECEVVGSNPPLTRKSADINSGIRTSGCRFALVRGYADNIGLLTGTRCGRDAYRDDEWVLKRLQAWWTQSMKAKPKKCISSGLTHGEPFDPKLKVRFSGGEWYPKFMGDNHFKFLSKGLVKDISDSYANLLVKIIAQQLCSVYC